LPKPRLQIKVFRLIGNNKMALTAAQLICRFGFERPPRGLSTLRSVVMYGLGTFRTWRDVRPESAFGGKADIVIQVRHVGL
jgi:hypothetical protein